MAKSNLVVKTAAPVVNPFQAEIDRLKAENEALKAKAASRTTLTLKVSEKGGLSLYGLMRFPVTLYKDSWLRLLAFAPTIQAFIKANDSKLSQGKDDPRFHNGNGNGQ